MRLTKKRRKIRVIGNSRSGTTWLAKVLNTIGYDVGHEYVREHGTVSCYFFMDTPRYPISPSTPPKGKIAHVGERLSDYRFDHTVMLVRHPIPTIGSIWATMGIEHQRWLEEYKVIPSDLKPKLLKSMYTWYEVNSVCEDRAEAIVRLENLVRGGRDWLLLLNTLEIPYVRLPEVPPKNASRGIFKAKTVTWEQMAALRATLTDSIRMQARRYGYEV